MKKITFLCLILSLLTSCSANKQHFQHNKANSVKPEIQLPESLNFKSILDVKTVEEAQIKARKALAENKIDLAQAYYVKGYTIDPDNVSLLLEMADLYKNIDKNDLADFCYQLILKHNPKHRIALEQYGLLLIHQKKYAEAQDKLLKTISDQDAKPNWQVLNALGLIEDLDGNYAKAIQYFEQALATDENQIDVLNNIGYSYYRSKQYDQAVEYFEKALAINPKYDMVLLNYGLLKGRIRDYQLAVNIFSELMSPAEANNNVGYIAMKNGDLRQATYYLHRAITTSSRYYKKAYENLQTLENIKTSAHSQP